MATRRNERIRKIVEAIKRNQQHNRIEQLRKESISKHPHSAYFENVLNAEIRAEEKWLRN